MPPLVEIGLSDLPKSGGAIATPAPPLLRSLIFSGRVRVNRPTPFRSNPSISRVKSPLTNTNTRTSVQSSTFDSDLDSDSLLQSLLNSDKQEMQKERPRAPPSPAVTSTNRFRPANRPQALQPRPVSESRPVPPGNDIGSGSVCFDFRSTNIVQLSMLSKVG